MKITVTHKIIGDFRHEYVATQQPCLTCNGTGHVKKIKCKECEGTGIIKGIYRLPFKCKTVKRNYDEIKLKLHKKNKSYSFMLLDGSFTHIKRKHIKFEKVDEYVLKEIIETPF